MIGSSGITSDWPSGIRTLNVNLKHDVGNHRITSLNNSQVPWPYNIILQVFSQFKIPQEHMKLGGIFEVTQKSISFMTMKGLNQTVGMNQKKLSRLSSFCWNDDIQNLYEKHGQMLFNVNKWVRWQWFENRSMKSF